MARVRSRAITDAQMRACQALEVVARMYVCQAYTFGNVKALAP